jgi:hypothetical protein
MIKALAPRMRQGCSGVWLLLLMVAFAPGQVLAQGEKPKSAPAEAATKKAAVAEDADSKAEPAAKKPATDTAEKKAEKAEERVDGGIPAAGGTYEVFRDERAENALKVFKAVGKKPVDADTRAIRNMAGAGGEPDRELIHRFVEGMAFQLTDKANLNAIIEQDKKPRADAAKAVGLASRDLLDALQTARVAKNEAFTKAYNKELLATLPKLLDNNLIARIQAMIVIAQIESKEIVPVCIAQLKDANQSLWVKLWAARGLTNLADGGRRIDAAGAILDANDAFAASKAVADFLEKEKELPWFLQMRAVEALGSMRRSALPVSMQKAEMAVAAMKYLADPDARVEVRAWAGWALGMMQVNPAIAKYNFPLVAYDLGTLAALVGERVNSSFKTNPTEAEYLTGLLVTPLFQAFNGIEGVRESGLLHAPAASASQGFIKQVADLESSIAKAAVELIRVPTGMRPEKHKDLSNRVASLKALLDKNKPKDFRLVPSGPEFRPQEAVAAGGGQPPKFADAPGGR